MSVNETPLKVVFADSFSFTNRTKLALASSQKYPAVPWLAKSHFLFISFSIKCIKEDLYRRVLALNETARNQMDDMNSFGFFNRNSSLVSVIWINNFNESASDRCKHKDSFLPKLN